MKNSLIYAVLFAYMTLLSSCEVIGDIFQAGIWVGVIIVVAVIGLILWLIGRGRR